MCRQPTTWSDNPWRPFCSERCQVTDLGTWAMEQYRIPGQSLVTELTILEPSDEQDRTDNT
jgi:Uncharacterized protein conserved in bacteria